MARNYHVCQSVRGALDGWTAREWRGMAEENGCTVDECKEWFRRHLFEGHEVVPMGEACEGFSYTTGCPGHEAG